MSSRDGRPEIYLMNHDRSDLSRITFNPSQPRLTSWSHDGQWIAFIVDGDEEEPGILLRNPDGVNLVRLTRSSDYEAVWSPKEEKIAFTSERGR